MGMNIMDIVALAKAGYKVQDVKDLIELSSSASTVTEPPAQAEPTSQIENTAKVTAQPTPAEPLQQAEPQDNAINIESLQKELEAAKEQIKNLQNSNTKQNLSNASAESDQDVMDNFVKSFM